MNTLKNWWLQITMVLLAIADLGFEVVNPLLLELGISDKTANVIKILFGIFAILRSKIELPTQNPDKLQDKVNNMK